MLPSNLIRALTIVVLMVGLQPAVSAKEETPFCAWAQGIIASTALVPEVIIHSDHEAFVESKPSDTPFVVHQFFSAPLADVPQMNTVVSCKMRTSERINHAHMPAAAEQPAAGPETSCDVIHSSMLEAAIAAAPAGAVALDHERWVIEPEDTRYIGPRWLQPWPFKAVSRGEGGKLHLHSRSLYAPHSWWMPMPERFQGNYYCHLVAPEYLHALVAGDIPPPL